MHRSAPRALLLSFCCVVGLRCAHAPDRRAKENARISYDVGVTAFDRGDTREALRALLASVRADPGLPETHNALGLVYHASGKEGLALEHYRRALSLRPKFSEAQNNLGILLLDMARYEEAIAAFEAALSDMLYPTPVLAQGNLGWALYRSGQVSEGRERIAGAVGQDPQFCRGYEWLMRIALDLDDPDEAVAQGRRLYALCLNNPKVAGAIGVDYRRDVDFHLAMAYLKLGRQADAANLLVGCSDVGDAAAASGSPAARCQAALEALQ